MDTVKLNAKDIKMLTISNRSNYERPWTKARLKILLNTCKTLEVIEISDILRVEAYQNYTKVYLENETMLLSSDSLTTLINMCGEGFFVCHKSHLVNLNKITRYHKEGTIELINGAKIPVARRRKSEFVEALEQWVVK